MIHARKAPEAPYAIPRYWLRIVPFLMLLSAIASAQTEQKSIHATIPPTAETLVPFETFPNAVCTLTAPDDTGTVVTHKLYADEAGVVRFYVTPPAESEQTFQVTFLCAAGDRTESMPVVLRASSTPTRDMPTVRTDFADRALRELGMPRTPLVGDPAAIPQEELLRMGYPPRPDPVKEQKQYEVWLRLASQPVRVIRPKLPRTARDERFSNIVDSQIWAGFALQAPSCNYYFEICDSFNYVEGAWNVPRVWNLPGRTWNATLGSWIGLDGGVATGGSGDVLQTGTASEAYQVCYFSTFCWGFTAYWSWTEWFGSDPHNTPIQVNPGDWVFAEAWYPGSGRTGYLYLENLTQGTGATLTESMPSGVSYFSGDSAEWIMERQPGPLPPSGFPQMDWAYVEGPGCPCTLDGNTPFVQYDMYNGYDLLTYPVLTGPTSMYWVFVQSQ